MHARYLCKRLLGRFPTLSLVVGLWDAQGDLNKARERIGCGALLFSSLADAGENIHPGTSPPLPPIDKQAVSACEQKVGAVAVAA
jgi:hypothetical protein